MEGIKWTCTSASFLQMHAIIPRAAYCLIETEYKQAQDTYVILNFQEAHFINIFLLWIMHLLLELRNLYQIQVHEDFLLCFILEVLQF